MTLGLGGVCRVAFCRGNAFFMKGLADVFPRGAGRIGLAVRVLEREAGEEGDSMVPGRHQGYACRAGLRDWDCPSDPAAICEVGAGLVEIVLRKVRSLRFWEAVSHADPAGLRSFGGLTPFSFAIRARNGRQRHGMPFAAHLYTASRSTGLPAALETQAATAVPFPSSLMNSR